jgi:hypothetical protein
MLLIIDAKIRILWLFCNVNKHPPLKILVYFLSTLTKESKKVTTIRVDEDGAFAQNFEFFEFLLRKNITLETTSGHASFLNGKAK